MPTSGVELWYCENVALGPAPYILMLLPLIGAYFYGREQRKLAWSFIVAWIAIQVPMSYVNYVVVRCPGDSGAMQQLQEMNEATQPPQAPQQ